MRLGRGRVATKFPASVRIMTSPVDTHASFVSHIGDDNGTVVERPLVEHLRDVASVAAAFASPFDAALWARTAGLWHDLGKYQARWQTYLRASHRQRAEDPHQTEVKPARPDRPNPCIGGRAVCRSAIAATVRPITGLCHFGASRRIARFFLG